MHEGVGGLLRDKSRPPGKAPIAPDRVAWIVSNRRRTRQPTGRCARWRANPDDIIAARNRGFQT